MSFPAQTTSLLDQDLKNIFNYVTSSLSILGCMWIFYYYRCSKQHPISLKLILALAMSDFVFSISNLISTLDNSNHIACQVEGVLRNFSLISSLYFSTSIGIWANYTFSKGQPLDQRQKSLFRKIVIGDIVLSFIFVLIPVMAAKYLRYGPQEFGCHVIPAPSHKSPLTEMITVLIFIGIPVLTAMIITVAAYARIAVKWRELASQFLPTGTDIAVYRLFLYPAVMFVSFIPSFIVDIIIIYYKPASATSFSNILHIVLSYFITHLIGFTNALVYGYLRKRSLQKVETKTEAKSTNEVE